MQYLSQDLILLALNPQTGRTRFSFYAALEYGLVGSLLLDLVLQGKLEIDNDNRVIGAIRASHGQATATHQEVSNEPEDFSNWRNWEQRYRDCQATLSTECASPRNGFV